MQIYQAENTYISIKDNYGNVRNEMMFIAAKSGWGKGLATEALIEEFHDSGYIIIVLADPKKELEFAYASILPRKQYHVSNLNLIGKKQKTRPVKIYHPFTLDMPRHKLPDINFYTFALQDMGREEWSMIAETSWDTDTIKLMINASESISAEDGLYGFLHHIQDITHGKTERRKLKPDPKNFYLSATAGTLKSLQDLSNYFQPFKRNCFLARKTCPLDLDYKKILSDQEHYHVFVTNWIKDRKLSEFTSLVLFNKFIENKEYAKHPILFVIPEIRFLTPFKPQGYKLFLAQGVKDNLSMIRSMGKGMSALFDTQVFSGVDEEVANSPTVTLYGELGGARDIEKVSKAMNYKRDIRQQLAKMDHPNSYLFSGEEGLGGFRIWFPSHMHCEPEYNFFDIYKQEHPDKLKDYKVLVDAMKKDFNEEETKFREKIKKKEEQEKKRLEAEKKAKEEKDADSKKVEAKIEKAQAKEDKSKEQLMKLCYETKQDDPKISNRKIAQKLGLNKLTVQRYIQEYKAKLDQEDSKDESEEAVKEWNEEPTANGEDEEKK